MPETIKCHCCNGTGRIPFTGIYADTLALLRKQRDPMTGIELARLAKCEGTAMCNRLAALESMGFAESKPYGRKKFWKAVQ